MKNSFKVSFLLIVFFFLNLFLFNGSSLASKSFIDLNTSGSHSNAVNYLNSLGIYDYKSGNKLNGNSNISRSEVSKILYNLYNNELPKIRSYNNNFKDINSKSLYSKEIIWSYEVGIFDGDINGKFNPNSSLNRGQMSKILVNSFNLESKGNFTFKDVNNSHWAFPYISILYGNGITVGDGKGNYLPNNKVTIYQLSSFIYRTLNLDSPISNNNNNNNNNLSDFSVPNKFIISLDSEYGFKWNVVGLGKSLELEGVSNNKVVSRYKTSVGSYSSLAPNLKIGINNKSEVLNSLGNPLDSIIKNNTKYLLGNKVGSEYGMYLLGDYYVTFFYDLHNSEKIRSILAIHKDFEIKKEGFYGNVSKLNSSRVSSENLMVLLMNQARESTGLNSLNNSNSTWTSIGRAHSKDMALNNYFSHTGLNGSSPFDRMISGGMNKNSIYWWGENLAYGQFNAIYAHEALMNSQGHRDNILHKEFTHCFVGLEFNYSNSPYFTIGFYSLH